MESCIPQALEAARELDVQGAQACLLRKTGSEKVFPEEESAMESDKTSGVAEN